MDDYIPTVQTAICFGLAIWHGLDHGIDAAKSAQFRGETVNIACQSLPIFYRDSCNRHVIPMSANNMMPRHLHRVARTADDDLGLTGRSIHLRAKYRIISLDEYYPGHPLAAKY